MVRKNETNMKKKNPQKDVKKIWNKAAKHQNSMMIFKRGLCIIIHPYCSLKITILVINKCDFYNKNVNLQYEKTKKRKFAIRKGKYTTKYLTNMIVKSCKINKKE